MNKIYRSDVDLKSAFSGFAKRGAATLQSYEAEVSNPSEQHHAVSDQAPNKAVPFRRRVKLLLRRAVAALYRLFKPFIRPLAYRARAFLVDGTIAELHAKFDREAEYLMSIQAQIQHLMAEMHASQLQSSASILKELQFMRELLEGDITEACAKIERNLTDTYAKVGGTLGRIEAYGHAGVRRFAVNCGDGNVLVRTEVGYIMCEGASDPAALAMLIESGDLERGTRLLIQRLLKPGDLFVDVGANLGLHTIAAARAMQGKGKIVAFEPFPVSARLLALSVLINGFTDIVDVHQVAVSTASGTRPLYLGRVSGQHSLFPRLGSGVEQQYVQVPLSRIDDVINGSERVALIKIDVEGAELEVLETAKSTIRHNPDIAMIVEFGPSHLRATGHDAIDWLASFTSLGLDWRVINADTGALERYSFERLQSVYSANLLFARAGSSLLSG